MSHGVGSWLGSSFRALGRRWGVLFSLGLVGFLLTVLAWVAMLALALAVVGFAQGWDVLQRLAEQPERLPALAEDPGFAMAATGLELIGLFVTLRIGCLFALAMLHAALDHSLGFSASLSAARPRTWPFLGLLVVHQLGVQLAALLLVIPGIVLAVRWSVAPQAFAAEGTGIRRSLGRSLELTKGRGLGIFGRALLLSVVCGLVAIVPIAGWVAAPLLGVVAWAELYRELAGR